MKLLSLPAFLAAGLSATRAVAAIRSYSILAEFQAHPAYLVGSGLLGSSIACIVAWGFWRGTRWCWWSALAALIFFPGWYWFDRFLLQGSRQNLPFVLITTILLTSLPSAFIFTWCSKHPQR